MNREVAVHGQETLSNVDFDETNRKFFKYLYCFGNSIPLSIVYIIKFLCNIINTGIYIVDWSNQFHLKSE
uniref:Uncharacterized protein n=1 Tax=Heterorhabditis bacteriophora TaxID=37862 RepID=A0A1I7X0W9_HETBA